MTDLQEVLETISPIEVFNKVCLIDDLDSLFSAIVGFTDLQKTFIGKPELAKTHSRLYRFFATGTKGSMMRLVQADGFDRDHMISMMKLLIKLEPGLINQVLAEVQKMEQRD